MVLRVVDFEKAKNTPSHLGCARSRSSSATPCTASGCAARHMLIGFSVAGLQVSGEGTECASEAGLGKGAADFAAEGVESDSFSVRGVVRGNLPPCFLS
jgi:hypothetical protein